MLRGRSVREQALYFADTTSKRIHRYCTLEQQATSFEAPGTVGFVQLRAGNGLVLGAGSKLHMTGDDARVVELDEGSDTSHKCGVSAACCDSKGR